MEQDWRGTVLVIYPIQHSDHSTLYQVMQLLLNAVLRNPMRFDLASLLNESARGLHIHALH